MFNSQKINNDPKPWLSGVTGVRYEEPSKYGHSKWLYRPRPEFDNNPNPLLTEIRELLHIPDRLETYRVNLEAINSSEYEVLQVEEHIYHARKVLERLVNVYSD